MFRKTEVERSGMQEPEVGEENRRGGALSSMVYVRRKTIPFFLLSCVFVALFAYVALNLSIFCITLHYIRQEQSDRKIYLTISDQK